MHYLALAVDYDGTIAHDGVVDEDTIAALERLRRGARKLILVTGRELPDLQAAMPRLDLFTLVVAENGALLYDPENKEQQPLGDPPPAAFVDALRARNVTPLSVGRVIVATWTPHEADVLAAIRDNKLDRQIIFNKGAVMVLPGGITKASGLAAALERLELSPANCVGIGDAENDLAFLDLCGLPVAVANALDTVKARAALVTTGVRGAGVAELIDRLLANDLADLDAVALRPRVALAGDERGEAVFHAPHRESILVTGQSGSGKSTLTLGLLERIAEAGLQWCVLDPEGDYENTEGAVTEGSATAPPDTEQALDLLRKTGKGVVVDMLAIPVADRPAFLARLLPEILALRARIGRPHVVVVDEAHHMLSRDWDPGAAAVPEALEGFLFITTDPDGLSPSVIRCVDRLVVVGKEPGKALGSFAAARGIAAPAVPPDDGTGDIVVLEPEAGPARRLASIAATGDRRRHRRKYAEGKLGEDTSFYFTGPEGKLKLRAHNLILFLDLADGVDAETWAWHRERGDYSAWLRDSVKDEDLAGEVAAIEADGSEPDTARAAIRAAVEQRYTAPG